MNEDVVLAMDLGIFKANRPLGSQLGSDGLSLSHLGPPVVPFYPFWGRVPLLK